LQIGSNSFDALCQQDSSNQRDDWNKTTGTCHSVPDRLGQLSQKRRFCNGRGSLMSFRACTIVKRDSSPAGSQCARGGLEARRPMPEEGNGRHYPTRFAHFGIADRRKLLAHRRTAYQIQFRFRPGIASCLRRVAGTPSGTIHGTGRPRASVPSYQRNGSQVIKYGRKRSPDHHPFRMVSNSVRPALKPLGARTSSAHRGGEPMKPQTFALRARL